jgi:hypothetical protein
VTRPKKREPAWWPRIWRAIINYRNFIEAVSILSLSAVLIVLEVLHVQTIAGRNLADIVLPTLMALIGVVLIELVIVLNRLASSLPPSRREMLRRDLARLGTAGTTLVARRPPTETPAQHAPNGDHE